MPHKPCTEPGCARCEEGRGGCAGGRGRASEVDRRRMISSLSGRDMRSCAFREYAPSSSAALVRGGSPGFFEAVVSAFVPEANAVGRRRDALTEVRADGLVMGGVWVSSFDHV